MLRWDIAHDSPEWHALRLKHVGGSECAALFGVEHQYADSLFTLHQVKSGVVRPTVVDDRPSTRVWLGKHLEPVVARMASEQFRWKVRYPGPYATDDSTPGLSASLDGIILEPGEEETRAGCHGPGVLEIKVVQYSVFKDDWEDRNEPPYPALLQTQHGMAASGLEWGVIVLLVTETGLVPYRYRRNERIIEMIRDEVSDFWARIRSGRAPNVDKTESTGRTLKAMFPERVQQPVLDLLNNKTVDNLGFEFRNAQANLKQSQANYQGAKNAIMLTMREHARAESASYWFRIRGSGAIDVSEKPESLKPKPRKSRRKASADM